MSACLVQKPIVVALTEICEMQIETGLFYFARSHCMFLHPRPVLDIQDEIDILRRRGYLDDRLSLVEIKVQTIEEREIFLVLERIENSLRVLTETGKNGWICYHGGLDIELWQKK